MAGHGPTPPASLSAALAGWGRRPGTQAGQAGDGRVGDPPVRPAKAGGSGLPIGASGIQKGITGILPTAMTRSLHIAVGLDSVQQSPHVGKGRF